MNKGGSCLGRTALFFCFAAISFAAHFMGYKSADTLVGQNTMRSDCI